MKGVIKHDGKGFSVRSEERIQGIAPRQFGVIYDANAKLCLGSGEISTSQIRAVHQL